MPMLALVLVLVPMVWRRPGWTCCYLIWDLVWDLVWHLGAGPL